jgi:hypothetical protein
MPEANLMITFNLIEPVSKRLRVFYYLQGSAGMVPQDLSWYQRTGPGREGSSWPLS